MKFRPMALWRMRISPGAGVAHGHIDEFELFGATGLVDLDGKGHGGSPGTKWNKCNHQSCHVSVALAVMLPWRTGYSG
jgi:hypothetical protein